MTFKKHTLNTYFSGMKKTLNTMYVFLHEFFLICLSYHVLSKIVNMTKTTLFSNFACFCTPKRCTHVHCLVLKNNPNYMIFFLRGWYPTSNTSAPAPPPPPRTVFASINQILLKSHFYINQNALKTLLHGWAGSRVLLGQSRIIFKLQSWKKYNRKNYN